MKHSSFRRDGHSLKTWRSTETHQEIRLKGCKPRNTPWSLSGCWPLNHYYKSPHHIPLGSDTQFWGYESAVSPFAQQSNKAIFLCCSVTQSGPTLCDPMDCSTPYLPVLTISRSLPKFISIALVVLSSHLIFWCPLLLLPSIFPSIRDFSNESALCIR